MVGMMHGDDSPLDKLKAEFDELRREVQQIRSQQIEQNARQGSLESRLITIAEILEDRPLP